MYVATKWYRAPELCISGGQYTGAVDVWSCGCILAEFYNRRPLFRFPDKQNPIIAACKIIGSPTDAELSSMGVTTAPAWLPRGIVGIPHEKLVPAAPKEALDLIFRMLTYDPVSERRN